MKNKLTSLGITGLLVSVIFFGFIIYEPKLINASRIIYVDDDYTFEDFTHRKTIQGGVDAAAPGDTVFVYSGTYNENVVVYKTINLTGENKDTTIIDAGGSGDVVNISADWVNITGFTAMGSGSGNNGGIKLYYVQNCGVFENNISNNGYGIYFKSSSYMRIINNIISSNIMRGISLWQLSQEPSSNDNVFINNTISSNGEPGIYTYLSSNNLFANNNILNNHGSGICLGSSNDNILTNNNISNSNVAIDISFSNNNIITGNTLLSNEDWGIFLGDSTNNSIIGNKISLSEFGIKLMESSNNTIRNNNVHNISNIDYPWPQGGIYLYGENPFHSSDNNLITNNNVSSNIGPGIHLDWFSSFNNITNNIVMNNSQYGIYLHPHSSNNIIRDNNVSNNFGGIYLASSYNLLAGNNIFSNSYKGVTIYGYNNDITGNDVFLNNDDGIYVNSSSFNNITSNNITNNFNGVHLDSSSDIKLTGNHFTNDGVFIEGSTLQHFNSHTMPDNNMVNSKPLYYYKDSNGISMDGIPVGEVILANCANVDVENLQIGSTDVGIEVAYSSDVDIRNNQISDNNYGIYLFSSSNSNLTNNSLLSNLEYGFYLSSSSDNRIYHNNIINNGIQAYDDQSNNLWNDTYPTGGNYWSDLDEQSEGAYDDYQGPNQDVAGSDDIVDKGSGAGGGKKPYIIDADSKDNYPLIHLPGNYIYLYEGWNLISIPNIQADTNLDSVLSSIIDSYDCAEWYNASDYSDNWKVNHTSKPPDLNDLDDIDHRMGFWIHITKPGGVLFQYSGIQPIENQKITLCKGWNLVGYPSKSDKARDAALNNIDFGPQVDAIWSYDAATRDWMELGPSGYFEVGRGYWIHSKDGVIWDVPL